jgi:hypothetical protein
MSESSRIHRNDLSGAFYDRRTLRQRKADSHCPSCDPPKIVLMADAAMVNLAVNKGGRPRVSWGPFESPVVVLLGQVFEVKWQAGPVVFFCSAGPPKNDPDRRLQSGRQGHQKRRLSTCAAIGGDLDYFVRKPVRLPVCPRRTSPCRRPLSILGRWEL